MSKDFLYYTGTYSDAGLVLFTGPGLTRPSAEIPLYSQMPDWKHITFQNTVSSLTGTKTQVACLTSVKTGSMTTSDTAAKKGDGSNAFAGAENTAAATEIVAMSREGASSATSNIGSQIAFKVVNTSVTAVAGNIQVLITK